MNDKDYLHERIPIPEDIKRGLADYVKGERVLELYSGDKPLMLLKTDGETFGKLFALNRRYLFRGDFTAPPEENGYNESECYITEDGLAGFSITYKGWLVSVFSNLNRRGFLNEIKPIVKEKAEKLVCIAASRENGGLIKAYEKILGYKVFAKTINDTEIMTKYYGADFMNGFLSHYGEPYHIFMVRAKNMTVSYEIKEFSDYFEADNYVRKYKIN